MPADGRQNVVEAGFEQTGDERIGMLRREGVGSQTVSREVPQVPSHDHVRLPVDRRSQYMAVAGIGQVESGGNSFVSRNDRFRKVPVHYRAAIFYCKPSS